MLFKVARTDLNTADYFHSGKEAKFINGFDYKDGDTVLSVVVDRRNGETKMVYGVLKIDGQNISVVERKIQRVRLFAYPVDHIYSNNLGYDIGIIGLAFNKQRRGEGTKIDLRSKTKKVETERMKLK